MRFRFTKIFLLAGFIYWASGLGQYLHERFEHWHPEETAQVGAVQVAGKNGGKPLQEADDHDDCQTCQSLKMMKAHAPEAPRVPEPNLPSVQTVSAVRWEAPALAFVVFLPARAPPASFSLSA